MTPNPMHSLGFGDDNFADTGSSAEPMMGGPLPGRSGPLIIGAWACLDRGCTLDGYQIFNVSKDRKSNILGASEILAKGVGRFLEGSPGPPGPPRPPK